MSTPLQVLKLHADDDVAIACRALEVGEPLTGFDGVSTIDAIPAAHKVALRDHAAGEALRRYGQIIGFATQAIRAGEHIHTHNLAIGEFDRDYAYGADLRP